MADAVTLVNKSRLGEKWQVPEGMVEAALSNGNGWVLEADADWPDPEADRVIVTAELPEAPEDTAPAKPARKANTTETEH